MSTNVTSEVAGSSGAYPARPARNLAATASNCRTCPNLNERRNVPNVDGARTPVNNRHIPAVPQHGHISNRISTRDHAPDQRGYLQPGRMTRPSGHRQMPVNQLDQAAPGRQAHRRYQPGVRHQVRLIEHRGPHRNTMRQSHPRDALPDSADQTLEKSDLAAPQGHPALRPADHPITDGTSGLSLNPQIDLVASYV